MKGKLIVLEGIDGSGKATQSALLEKSLVHEGYSVKHISFPDYDSPSSSLVKMYLHGDFGKHPDDVNPYAASIFFAVDRFASYRVKWKEFYLHGGIVLADRYTTSNMAHQMTKFSNRTDQKKFLQWLDHMEYEELEIPRPDLVILLDVPVEISEELIHKRAAAGGSMDIHEKDSEYLKRCHDAYEILQKEYGWDKVSCTREGRLRSEDSIARDVLQDVHSFL